MFKNADSLLPNILLCVVDPSVVDLGKCLPGTTMKAIVTIENKGGFGLFYVMRRSEYDAFTESEYKLKEDRVGVQQR